MVRFPDATSDMPWRADRPAIAFYDAVAGDNRLSDSIQKDAKGASDAVRNLVLAHSESTRFAPFDGSDYSDAVGPTVHIPTSRNQIDPWAQDGVSETNNAFYKNVDQGKFVGVVA
jgi:hypothetical protein